MDGSLAPQSISLSIAQERVLRETGRLSKADRKTAIALAASSAVGVLTLAEADDLVRYLTLENA